MGSDNVTTWIRRLQLATFRNYTALALDLDSRPIVLAGPNGAGKTNLLEAISFLAPGRGLRRAELADVVPRAACAPAPGRWAISASIMDAGEEIRVGTAVEPGHQGGLRRIAKVDQSAVSLNSLASCLGLIWLTPQLDRLFLEGPSGRRRFLDRIILSRDPAHAGRINAYDRAMRERQRLLSDGGRDTAWLAALETAMVEAGIAVAAARRDLVADLGALCAEHAVDGFPVPEFAMSGPLEELMASAASLEAEEHYTDVLAENRGRDSYAGRTHFGPHVSDLMVVNRTSGLAARDCSTGEQKALLVSIILASARLERAGAQAGKRHKSPILLLDEIGAHLDEDRRHLLFDALCGLGCQVWMTGTDVHLFNGLRDRSQFFEVSDGAIHPLTD